MKTAVKIAQMRKRYLFGYYDDYFEDQNDLRKFGVIMNSALDFV